MHVHEAADAAAGAHQVWLSRAGICPAGRITCLVVDECHRATGKADIVLAVKRMREAGVKFRVLGLSATPGRDRESVQVTLPLPTSMRINELRASQHNTPAFESDPIAHGHAMLSE